MNKISITLALSLLAVGSVFAAGTAGVRCMEPFGVTIANKSEGLAQVVGGSDIKNVHRGDKIQDGKSKSVLVEENGAKITLKFGPEEKKTTKTIHFFGKTDASAHITLMPQSVKTQGFNNERPKMIAVELVNHSGGNVKVLDAGNSGLKQGMVIAQGKSHKAKVNQASSAVFKSGPEDNKSVYTVGFAAANGKNPTVVFNRPSVVNRVVSSKDIATSVRPTKHVHGGMYIRTHGTCKTHHKAIEKVHSQKKERANQKTEQVSRKQKAEQAVR